MNAVYVCKCCNQIAEQLQQPALFSGGSTSVQITCKCPGCDNHNVTKDNRDTADIDRLFKVFAGAQP